MLTSFYVHTELSADMHASDGGPNTYENSQFQQ
jgi:hypothetical protein